MSVLIQCESSKMFLSDVSVEHQSFGIVRDPDHAHKFDSPRVAGHVVEVIKPFTGSFDFRVVPVAQ